MKAVKYIATHLLPHLDEIFAILLLQLYGEKKYPGVNKAKVEFLEVGNDPVKYYPDSLYVGISGDGPEGDIYDEHPMNGRPRKEGHSAASLVACDLQIQNLPEVRKLLEYVTDEDMNANGGFMDLAVMCKLFYRDGRDSLWVMDWATVALEARMNEQRELLDQDQLKEFDKRVKNIVVNFGQKPLRIGAIETDNPLAAKFSRMRGVNILIQKNSDGHVQIFPRIKDELDMRDAVRLLRLEELELAEMRGQWDWKDLEAETSIDCPIWYLMPNGGMIMNGSQTHKDVVTTRIPLDRIVELIKQAFDDNAEHVSCNICIHNPRPGGLGMQCPSYKQGFLNCRKIRYEAKKELQQQYA